MTSIGAAPSAATTRVGHARIGHSLAAGLTGERAPAQATRAAEAEDAPEASFEDGALLVAVEAGLREAGYLANRPDH